MLSLLWLQSKGRACAMFNASVTALFLALSTLSMLVSAQVMTFTGASPSTFSGPGQVITFNLSFGQSNATTASITLNSMNYAPDGALTCAGLPLAPNGTTTCSFTYTTTAADTFDITQFGSFVAAPPGGTPTRSGSISNQQVVTWAPVVLPTASISVSPASVAEDGATNLVYTVTLSAAATSPVTVNINTSGTATAGTDYTGNVASVTIPTGSSSATITINPTVDGTVEADETVRLSIASGTGYTIGSPSSATGTILNDDVPSATISVSPASVAEDGAPNLIYTVTLNQASLSAISINFNVGGTATNGTDYATIASPLVIPAGNTTGTITVNPTADATIEGDETVTITLAAGTGYTVGALSSATGTILNDDLPNLTINDVTANEGNAGITNFIFTVSLSAPAGPGGVTFNIATANGTATAGADYVANSLTSQTIPQGSSTYTFTVQVNGDTLNEPSETFFVNVTSVTGAVVVDGQGVGTIVNDDPLPTLSIDDVSIVEGNAGTTNAVFTVSLSAASGQTVTVNYATADGTATQPSDYSNTSGTLTFTPGQTTRTITVPVNGDTTPEANETFFVNLSGATNATISDNQGVGTITNDDVVPTASIVVSDTSLTAGETTLVTFTFNTAVTGFTNADLTIANGSLSSVASADGGVTWTATFTPNTNLTVATNAISLNLAGVQSLGGTAGTGTANSNNYAIDTVRPTATIVMADNSLTIGETSLLTITFNEPVTGFTNADLTVPNGTLSAVSSADGGVTWTATFTPTAGLIAPTNAVTLDNAGVADAAGNTGAGTTNSNNYGVFTATITVSPTTLPNGVVGTAYSQTVSASGGTSPYTFAVTAGALPGGLTLASGGLLSTNPTTPGTFNFTITATDSTASPGPFSNSRAYTVTIALNGACGTANGVASVAAPSGANLCAAGSLGVAGVTSGATSYAWGCDGAFGGTTATCSAPRQYTVTGTASPIAGGTVSCNSPVNGGTSSTCTPNPASGYVFASWSGDCTGTGACSIANITANKTVTATFALITPGSCGASNGVASLIAPTANLCGDSSTPTVTTTATNFTWTCAGANSGASASCNAPRQYTVSTTAGANGTLSCASSVVTAGSTTTCTAVPAGGYITQSINGCGGTATAAGTSNYTTGAVSANCSVGATFVQSVNGVCGSANAVGRATAPSANLCANGVASAVTGSGPWGWTCSGTNGGTAAACNAPLAPLGSTTNPFVGTTVPPANSGGLPSSASVTFVSTNGGASCGFDNAATGFIASTTVFPVLGTSQPHGMFRFKMTNCTAGFTARISVTWPSVSGMRLYKYGKATLGASVNSFYFPNNVSVVGNTVSFDVTDGALGDEDGVVNGEIVDPVSMVALGDEPVATPVPATNNILIGMLILLVAGMGLSRAPLTRRRRQ